MNKRKTALEKEILSNRPVITLTDGDSMEPLLFHHSSQIVIIKAKLPLKKGDLPLYKRPNGQFVLHRIVKVKGNDYYTRGDNRYAKEKVPSEWILGVVTEIYRKNRHIKVTDLSYRLYVKIWNVIFPLRYIIYRGRSFRRIWKKRIH